MVLKGISFFERFSVVTDSIAPVLSKKYFTWFDLILPNNKFISNTKWFRIHPNVIKYRYYLIIWKICKLNKNDLKEKKMVYLNNPADGDFFLYYQAKDLEKMV